MHIGYRQCESYTQWQGVPGKKVPHFIYLMNDPVFAVAGLHEWWKSPAGEELETFTIVTTNANAVMAPLHNRMPVIVPPERYARAIAYAGVVNSRGKWFTVRRL